MHGKHTVHSHLEAEAETIEGPALSTTPSILYTLYTLYTE